MGPLVFNPENPGNPVNPDSDKMNIKKAPWLFCFGALICTRCVGRTLRLLQKGIYNRCTLDSLIMLHIFRV
jgi:hypothetical protein